MPTVGVTPIGLPARPLAFRPQFPYTLTQPTVIGDLAMFTDPTTGEKRNGVMKVRYTHDAMIDLIIAQPTIKQNDLAAIFDRSPGWVSLIMNSDAFQARLAERRTEVVDPVLTATLSERLSAVADISLQRLLEKVSMPVQIVSDDFMLQTAKFATGALGYGARPAGGDAPQVNVGVVVHVPPKIDSPQAWIDAHAPSKT